MGVLSKGAIVACNLAAYNKKGIPHQLSARFLTNFSMKFELGAVRSARKRYLLSCI